MTKHVLSFQKITSHQAEFEMWSQKKRKVGLDLGDQEERLSTLDAYEGTTEHEGGRTQRSDITKLEDCVQCLLCLRVCCSGTSVLEARKNSQT